MGPSGAKDAALQLYGHGGRTLMHRPLQLLLLRNPRLLRFLGLIRLTQNRCVQARTARMEEAVGSLSPRMKVGSFVGPWEHLQEIYEHIKS